MKWITGVLLFLFVAAATPACNRTAPTTTPLTSSQKASLYRDNIVSQLSLFRNFAVDGARRGLISKGTATRVIEYHRAALVVINSAAAGWNMAVNETLNQFEKQLASEEQDTLAPYLVIIRALLKEVK